MVVTSLQVGVIFAVAMMPAIATVFALHRQKTQTIVQARLARQVSLRLSSHPSGRSPVPEDPEALYISGVGFVIGDISCQFNGRSPFLRCAVNPCGPCADCHAYNPVSSPVSNLQNPS